MIQAAGPRFQLTAVGLMLACLAACGPSDEPASITATPDAETTSAAPPQVPEPNMVDMEPQVAERLRQVRSAVLGRPESADAWGHLGMVCHVHELWDCADIAYREAEALDPIDERWHYYLGDVLSVVGTDPDSAERAFRRTLELHPDYAPAHLRLGRVLMARNESNAAAEQFERALVLAPDLQPARVSLAQLRLADGNLSAATDLLQTVLESQPRNEQALSTLGQVYMRQGLRDEARKIAERARTAAAFNLFSDPLMGQVVAEGVSSVLLWDRAKAYFDNGNFEQAALGLRQVAELQPDNPDVHHQLAVAYRNLGRLDLAMRHLERVVDLDPERLDPNVLLASLYLDHQRPQDALPLLRRALTASPNDLDARWLLGRAQVLTGDLEAGIATFEAARKTSPSRAVPAWADNEWGNALAQSGRLYGALEHFESALVTDPNHAQTLFFLGLVHEGLGRAPEAAEFYCRSMRSQPNPPAAGRLQALGRSCN